MPEGNFLSGFLDFHHRSIFTKEVIIEEILGFSDIRQIKTQSRKRISTYR